MNAFGRLALVSLAATILAPTASADRFYFGTEETANQITEGTADFVEGVLLKEEDDNYVIRVEGGEITVAKSSVWKIEKDDLTVAQLEQRETDAATALAEANTRRVEILTADAAARRDMVNEARAADAAAQREDDAAAADAVVPAVGVYDPILGVFAGSDAAFAAEQYIRQQFGGYMYLEFERYYRELRRFLREQRRRNR